MEPNDQDKSVLIDPNPRRILQMKLDLLHRRKRLLILHYSGNINPISLKMLAEQLTKSNEENGIPIVVTEEALRRDYNRRAFWEPLIWATYQNTEDTDPTSSLKFLGLARMKAIALMESADNDNAKVGAVGKLTNVVEKEITLKQSLGLLPRVNMEPTSKVDLNVKQQIYFRETTELLRNYEFLFKGGASKSNIRADGAEEQVADSQASDNS